MDRETYRAQHNQRVKSYHEQGKLTPEELDAMAAMAGGGSSKPQAAWPGEMPEGAMTDEELQRMADLAGKPGTTGGGMSEEELDRIAGLAGGGGW